ncbi:MAG: hypothetical protein E7329_01375 [Clostridiales bacterium]|nr:hypothetical protein [Clostridiales bacterium]
MKNPPCILVLVTVQKECSRLIQRGKAISDEQNLPLHVLHVATGKNLLGTPDAAAALNHLFSLAHEVDAEMNILYESNALSAIARYAKEHSAQVVVTGPDKSGFSSQLEALLPEKTTLLCLEE